MNHPVGPGTFTVLFDEAEGTGPSLPDAFQRTYGGDWRLPASEGRPYVFVNFAISHDGRISFSEPGHMRAGDVTGFNQPDRWLMALLRARADAVMVGDNTFRVSPDHLWTSEHIYPPAAGAFAGLRRAEGRRPVPLHVFLSLDGNLAPEAKVFGHPEVHIIVATTERGSEAARRVRHSGRIDVLDLGRDLADLAKLMRILKEGYGVQTLVCEGGARVYGSLLQAGQVDDEFLTICPLIIGNREVGPARPGLVEGSAFMPGAAPRLRPISLRRAGDYLFLRACCEAVQNI